MGTKKEAWGLLYSGLGIHQLGSRTTIFIPRWKTHLCILYQVRDARGAHGSRKVVKLTDPSKHVGREILATYINGRVRTYVEPWLAHYQFIDHMPSAVVHFAHKHTSHKRTVVHIRSANKPPHKTSHRRSY